MTRVPAWFERTFAFPFPVQLLPNLRTRLHGTPARLEAMVSRRTRATLIARRDDKWSAQENAGHLLDLEPLWLARTTDYLSSRDQLTVADLANRKTDDANHNARTLNEILGEFRGARENLLRLVDDLDPSHFGRSIPHPRLKTPMRLADHLFFVAEHDDHHLARIWELISTVR